MPAIQGLHHVTVMASDPQKNLDFYVTLLGQRFVKRTVNFDDPGTYHFYYGDLTGQPGTIMTFFPWPNAKRGQLGSGETSAVAYSIKPEALKFWQQRLDEQSIDNQMVTRFGQEVLSFADPDGLRLELVAEDKPLMVSPWLGSDIPEDKMLNGFFGVRLLVNELASIQPLLSESLNYQLVAQEDQLYRFQSASGALANILDIEVDPTAPAASMSAGTVHHIALRVADDAEQAAYLSSLRLKGYNVTPVQDRQYFRSIYFRSRAGVLFELATDIPGFPDDEAVADLGKGLKLPHWLEPKRERIEARVLPISVPEKNWQI
jgi:glyoxalase family protein